VDIDSGARFRRKRAQEVRKQAYAGYKRREATEPGGEPQASRLVVGVRAVCRKIGSPGFLE
jgi:hypothetical protein